MPHILPPEEIAKKYREAIVHYSKHKNAGIVETEASFKATRISIEQNCTLQAASFLNNVVFINLTLSEQEKVTKIQPQRFIPLQKPKKHGTDESLFFQIERFTTLSELFTAFGFTRKASFCLRLAATRHVSQSNPNPDWQQCYNLMLQAAPGLKLCLDPIEMPSGEI